MFGDDDEEEEVKEAPKEKQPVKHKKKKRNSKAKGLAAKRGLDVSKIKFGVMRPPAKLRPSRDSDSSIRSGTTKASETNAKDAVMARASNQSHVEDDVLQRNVSVEHSAPHLWSVAPHLWSVRHL